MARRKLIKYHMKWLILAFLFGAFLAPETKAVFNGEAEKPGLLQEVITKKETQLAQGEIDQIRRQHAALSTGNMIKTISSVEATTPAVTSSTSSSWIGQIQTIVFLAAAVGILFWIVKIV